MDQEIAYPVRMGNLSFLYNHSTSDDIQRHLSPIGGRLLTDPEFMEILIYNNVTSSYILTKGDLFGKGLSSRLWEMAT